MLKHSRAFLAWSCFVFVIAASALMAAHSPSYQKCASEYERHNRHSEQTGLYNPVASSAQLPLFFVCEGAFIDENGVTITALATIAIAGFTLTLWRATSRAASLTLQAIELGNKEFAATHRPRFEIRFEQLVVDDVTKATGSQRIVAEFRLENFGAGNGRVIGSRVVLDFFTDGSLPHPDDLRGDDVIGDITLNSGSGWRFRVWNKELFYMVDIYEQGFQYLYLIGWILYEDTIGRQTAYFCRKYSRGTDSFTRVANSDYERNAD